MVKDLRKYVFVGLFNYKISFIYIFSLVLLVLVIVIYIWFCKNICIVNWGDFVVLYY